jgi:hypothetical protein
MPDFVYPPFSAYNDLVSQNLKPKYDLGANFSFLSAQRTPEHNQPAHQALGLALKQAGFDHQTVHGNYDHNEQSFHVKHDGSTESVNKLNAIGKEFKQESVFHHLSGQNELHFADGRPKWTGTGHSEGEHLNSYFTALPDGRKVQYNLDQPKEQTAEKVEKSLAKAAPLRLVHFSNSENLQEIDPAKHGTGVKGAESRRGISEVPRSYYYVDGTKPESIVSSPARSKYTVELSDPRIYDLAHDKDGHIKAAVEANGGARNPDMEWSKIRSAGFHGVTNSGSSLPNVVALFNPMKPVREEKLKKSAPTIGQLQKKAHQLQDSIQKYRLTISGKELAKSDQESCPDCSGKVLMCSCFTGLAAPGIGWNKTDKQLEVLFKSDWTEELRDSFMDSLKSRGGAILRKHFGK